MDVRKIRQFRSIIWSYYRNHKRDFPWRPPTLTLRQGKANPYKILVSEIMLQQTQTDRVIPKYELFLKEFPSFQALAKAPVSNVLKTWQGLGYNRRALFLKRTAEIVVERYGGKLPRDPELLRDLPGIGRGTAGAILAFAFNKPSVFIETNIRRVFIHHFFARKKKVDDKEILALIERSVDKRNPREWYYALMDYGTMLGIKEKENPNKRSAHYAIQSKFKGSLREVRGKILQILVRQKFSSEERLAEVFGKSDARLLPALKALKKEGFVVQRGDIIKLVR